jgi:uncharacterized membrane protein YgdD (TMEM256/DUF423 family)
LIKALIFAGGLSGAAGVVLSALGAHYPGAGNLVAAANFLLFHAPLFLALAAFLKLEILPRWLIAALGIVFVAGLALFAGDLALRVFTGARLFHSAAPLGGTLLIAGWTGLALGGLFARR